MTVTAGYTSAHAVNGSRTSTATATANRSTRPAVTPGDSATTKASRYPAGDNYPATDLSPMPG